jgi:hypothetical protein
LHVAPVDHETVSGFALALMERLPGYRRRVDAR